MAIRRIGDAVVTIEYVSGDRYRGTVRAGGHTWKFDNLNAPRAGFAFAYDSPQAYDKMAQSAVSFASYYTSHNRGHDTPDWAPSGEAADAIDQAVSIAQDDRGDYTVSRMTPEKATHKRAKRPPSSPEARAHRARKQLVKQFHAVPWKEELFDPSATVQGSWTWYTRGSDKSKEGSELYQIREFKSGYFVEFLSDFGSGGWNIDTVGTFPHLAEAKKAAMAHHTSGAP